MSLPQNVILVFDRTSRNLLVEVIPDTFEAEAFQYHDPLKGQSYLKVPLSVYWTWQPGQAAQYVAQSAG